MKKILFFAYTMDMGGAEKSLLDTINFLSSNEVLEYVDLSLLEEYNRDFLNSNEIIKRKVLKLC